MTYAEARAELEALFIAIYRTMEREGGDTSMRAVEGIIAGLQQHEGDSKAMRNAYGACTSLSRTRPFGDVYVYRDHPKEMRAENQLYRHLMDRTWLLLRAAHGGTLGALPASRVRGTG